MKRVLVIGEHSYIGTSFARWAEERHADELEIVEVSSHSGAWRTEDPTFYDAIVHVAGVAHVGETAASRSLFYSVNRDLATEVATWASNGGVGQFVLLSSMSVYGGPAPYGRSRRIGANEEPAPITDYGASKLQAERAIADLASDSFKVVILRPPMVYGPGCPGNYRKLARLALKLPIFPDVNNERSVIYVDNLSELICQVVISGVSGTYMPQDVRPIETSKLAVRIAEAHGKTLHLVRALNPLVSLASILPGRIGELAGKAFGSLSYENRASECGLEYQVVPFREAILQTEGADVPKCRKVLFCATTARGHITAFHIPYLHWFKDRGWETWVAAADDFPLGKRDIPFCDHFVEVPFCRNPLSLENLKASQGLRKLLLEQRFDLVHVHTPVAAACLRATCGRARRLGTKVAYTAHGFHFYRGAPLPNWLLYYPVEWLCSWRTDALVAINREDYSLARKHLHAKKTYFVPGVGVDVRRFSPLGRTERDAKRLELGLSDEDFVLVNVGELNANKNQVAIVEALALLPDDVRLLVAGEGPEQDRLERDAKLLGVSERVRLLGRRDDVPGLLAAADAYVCASLREGLPVAVMEAMAAGVPVISARVRGAVPDLLGGNGVAGLVVDDYCPASFAAAVSRLMCDPSLRKSLSVVASERVRLYGSGVAQPAMQRIYEKLIHLPPASFGAKEPESKPLGTLEAV